MKGSKHILPLSALLLVTLLLSLPSFHHGHIWEDHKFIRPYGPGEIAGGFVGHWEPTMQETGGYRPLHAVHYALSYLLIGGDPFRNHLLQTVLLAGVVLLIYALAFCCAGEIRAAFWTALVYPCLGTTAWQICWTAHRQHLLLLLFLLAFLLLYDRHLRTGSKGAYIVSLAFLLPALLLKETAILFPPLAFCMAALIREKSLRSQVRPMVPYLILIALLLLVRCVVVSRATGAEPNPPIPLHPVRFVYEYSRSLFATLVQTTGIRNVRAPFFDSGIVSPRDYAGLLAAAGFFSIGGGALLLGGRAAPSSMARLKRTFLFGLAILIVCTFMVAVWYRTNRLYLSSVGVSLMVGAMLTGVIHVLLSARSTARRAAGVAALLFFAAFLAVNLKTFFQIQHVLRPRGPLVLFWDEDAYSQWQPYMGKEGIRILEDKLRGAGRLERARAKARERRAKGRAEPPSHEGPQPGKIQ